MIFHLKYNFSEPSVQFSIKPQQFYIESQETKTLECIFQPKTVSNILLVELEATIHFKLDQSPLNNTTIEILPKYVAPMNLSIKAMGK